MSRGINYFIDTVSQDYVEGWAVAPSGACSIDVLLDGRVVGQAATGLPRDDVGAAFPNVPGSAKSGFLFAFREADFGAADRDVTVTLRLTADRVTVESAPVTVPVLRPASGQLARLPRAPFPPGVVEVALRQSPSLASADLASASGAQATVDVLAFLANRGPRPLPGVHRYLGFLRSVHGAALFAAKYFPKANARTTGAKDQTSMLTGPRELVAIAHHLYVLAEAGIPGVLLEFGCFKGYSTSVLSTACHLLGRSMEVFDSFEGLPATDSTYYRPGEFAGSLREVSRNVEEFGRPQVVTYRSGFFSHSVPRWAPQPVACFWMDVDLEQSAIDALAAFPHLDVRGALFTHECQAMCFSGSRPTPRRGPDNVVGPIVDAFQRAGREPVGTYLFDCTGAMWDEAAGVPVLPAAAFERLLDLALS
jgi:hypothetical protein